MSTPSVLQAVAACIDTFVERRREEIAAHGPDARGLVEAAAASLQGGKGLRARFCRAGWSAVARRSTPAAAEADALWETCASLEVFQASALVHDDVIDNSDTRRGRPSMHRVFETAHADAGWSGNGAAFGRSSAILLGDLLLAWSDDLLETGLTGHPHADAVRSEYARMRRDVTLGQYLDVAEEAAWSVNDDSTHAERALRVASLKSARYSVEQPLLIGAALAGAAPEQRRSLQGFGHPVGMAFQLRDDVLGVFGDEDATGKPAGDDLREGKRTLLIAWTREALAAPGRRLVDELLGDPALTPDQIASLQAAIVESGALRRVEELIVRYAADADTALRDAPLDAHALDELRELARAATSRIA
ncbi:MULTISPECIES: polyprenyl synthetase family protein [Bacteria]|uniref:polyprenyl synthetase family protein n=1 Tax=Bacteria TaxID=2 RepID=UPI003C7C57B2